MEGSIYQVPHNENFPQIVEGKDLETLIIASIETLKRKNKKCGKKRSFPFSTRICGERGYERNL